MTWVISGLLVLPFASLILGHPNAMGTTKSYDTDIHARDSEDQYPWAALGDSFAAGPGAGDPFDEFPDSDDCFRNLGAYPPQLAGDFPFPSNAMQFLACTGDVVDDMIDRQLPKMDTDQQFVTLSIGGNDMKFGAVIRACLLKPGGPASADCQTTIDKAQAIIDDKLEGILFKAYDAIFARLGSDYKRKVFIELYPQFFNEDTEWCKDHTMGLIPGYRPLLTKDLRHRLNQLAVNLRNKMKRVIQKYYDQKASIPHTDGGWAENRIFFSDEFDTLTYPGHRFCEKKHDGKFEHEDIWFFKWRGNDSPATEASNTTNTTAAQISAAYDASTCKDDPRYDTDDLFGWGCDFSLYIAADNIYKRTKRVAADLAYPRSQNIDEGLLTCRIEHAECDTKYYFSRENALQAIADFCVTTHKSGTNFTGNVMKETGGVIVGFFDDDPMPQNCPVTDPTANDFVAMCKERLGVPLQNCDKVKRSSDAWKQGGIFYRDCTTWSIGRHFPLDEVSVSADNATTRLRRRATPSGF